jgi:hypothetical protein
MMEDETLERGEALDAPVMSELRGIPTSVVTKNVGDTTLQQ